MESLCFLRRSRVIGKSKQLLSPIDCFVWSNPSRVAVSIRFLDFVLFKLTCENIRSALALECGNDRRFRANFESRQNLGMPSRRFRSWTFTQNSQEEVDSVTIFVFRSSLHSASKSFNWLSLTRFGKLEARGAIELCGVVPTVTN